jgi:hypothetical protein
VAAPKKLLFIDIEVSKAEVWCYPNRQGKPTFIKKKDIKRNSEIISIAWYWEKEKYINCIGWDYNAPQRDYELVKRFIEEIPKAKAVVGHFIDGFDMPWLRYKCIKLGLNPFGNIPTKDTVKMCRPFKFYSKKLNDVAQELGIGCKNEITDDDWDAVKRGCKKTLLKVMDYNCQDVDPLLTGVYYKLDQYTEGSRNKTNENDPCNQCGILLQKWDTRVSALSGLRYQRYRCPGCGKIEKSNRRIIEDR